MEENEKQSNFLVGWHNPITRCIYLSIAFGSVLLCMVGAYDRVLPNPPNQFPIIALAFPYILIIGNLIRMAQRELQRKISGKEAVILWLVPVFALTLLSAGLHIANWSESVVEISLMLLIYGLGSVFINRSMYGKDGHNQ